MRNKFQTASSILMVRPAKFGFNEQTAESNAFQHKDSTLSNQEISQKALIEFDQFVEKLISAGIQVIVAEDSHGPAKPDAVFPNNWVTFHESGTVITYPMMAETRRTERREEILNQVSKDFEIKKRLHLEHFEDENRFLEGTGSMILDRVHKVIYACISPRTDNMLLKEIAALEAYRPIVFHAVDGNDQEIYHTNVMMALGETFVVICMDTIKDKQERKEILDCFAETGKEVIEISIKQMLSFAGNMLQLRNDKGQTILVMSEQAFLSLNTSQINSIERHTNILYSPINTIETYGGGSARCMIAEVFLPPRIK